MRLNYYERWKNSTSSLADHFLKEKKPEAAERLLWKVLLINPQEWELRAKRMDALKALNKWEFYRSEALLLSSSFALFGDVLEKFPGDINFMQKALKLASAEGNEEAVETLYQALAKTYLGKSLPFKAVEMFEKMMVLLPEKFQYHRDIAEIFLTDRKLEKAAESYFVLANKYLDNRQITEAAVSLEQILTFSPSHKEARFLLTRVYLEQNKVAEASEMIHEQIDRFLEEKQVDEAVTLSHRFIALLAKFNNTEQAGHEQELLAAILFFHERQEEAIALMLQVAERELSRGDLPKYLSLMRKGLDFYIGLGNLARLIEFYEKMIFAVSGIDVGKAKLLLDEFIQTLVSKEKISDLDLSLRRLRKNIEERGDVLLANDILIQLAEVYVSLYRLREAIKIYEVLAKSNEKTPELYCRLGELYLTEENMPQAVDAYLDAIEIYIRDNREKKAEEIFHLIHEQSPANPMIPGRMGQLFYTLGEWDKALHFYEISLGIDGSYRQAVLGTAMAYAKKGMLDEMVALAKRLVNRGFAAEVIQEYRKALAAARPQEDIDLPLGLVYKDLGFMEEAVAEFQKAAKHPRYFLEACNQLGLCFKLQGLQEQAIRQYLKVLENPDFSEEETLEIRYNLAGIYEELQMIPEARELYHDIMMFDIDYRDVHHRLKNLRGKESGKIISITQDSERTKKSPGEKS